MLLKEDFNKDDLKKVFSSIRNHFESGNEQFDETIGAINFWCDGDKDKTIFMQSDDAYAQPLTYQDIVNGDEDEMIAQIKIELAETDNEEISGE